MANLNDSDVALNLPSIFLMFIQSQMYIWKATGNLGLGLVQSPRIGWTNTKWTGAIFFLTKQPNKIVVPKPHNPFFDYLKNI